MYSVVLMAALASGSSAPDFGHRCSGCYGGCWGGCYGSCYGGCYGGWGCHGCHGGWGGCYGGYGGCYGCYGACHGGWGCYGAGFACWGYGSGWSSGWGYGCTGCYGCYGGYSCYGYAVPYATSGVPVAPGGSGPVFTDPGHGPGPGHGKEPEVTPEPGKKKKGTEKGTDKGGDGDEQARARVHIDVPAAARLYIDGQLMKGAAGRRSFQTPPLEAGRAYFYDVRVELDRDGKTLSDARRLIIRPGQDSNASFASLGQPEPAATATARSEE